MPLFNWRSTRREFVAHGWLGSALAVMPIPLPRLQGAAAKSRSKKFPNIYDRLGVRTRINAKGTYTYLTGSLMPPEVAQAQHEAAEHYVFLEELQAAAGRKIAELLGVEAAMVTSGAAGAMTLGTAACVAGKDEEKIRRIPDTIGMKNEVILQKTHRNGYNHAMRNVGVRMIEIETVEEAERAINDNTAMLFFLNWAQNRGKIGLQQWVELGKKHGIPTFNDAAADVPPVSHLNEYNKMGFDLVAFSGGKGLRGPQCAGLLLGRKDLIEAALANNNPHDDTVGRGMKVGKEEIVAMYAAVERYLKVDHEQEWEVWERKLDEIEKMVSSVPGIQTGRFVPEVANHVPHLYLHWDEAALVLTRAECAKRLEDGEPSIVCLVDDEHKGVAVTPYMMQPGDELIVARRLRAILMDAHKRAVAA
jgi:D-glucosaminate-6-phosphate ammonia-lyase